MALQQVGSTTPFNGSSVAVVDATPFDLDSPPAVVAAPIQTVNYYAELEKKGFTGMRDDWRTSPMISLKTDGQFEDATGESYGKVFLGSCVGGRHKFAYSFSGATDPRTELVYSYDRITTTKTRQDGSTVTVEEFKAELASRGKEMTCKEYYEVDVILSAPGTPLDGESRTLSVAPSSTSAFFAHMKKMERFNMVYTHLTRFKVGDKVKFGNAPAFYPWVFEIAA